MKLVDFLAEQGFKVVIERNTFRLMIDGVKMKKSDKHTRELCKSQLHDFAFKTNDNVLYEKLKGNDPVEFVIRELGKDYDSKRKEKLSAGLEGVKHLATPINPPDEYIRCVDYKGRDKDALYHFNTKTFWPGTVDIYTKIYNASQHQSPNTNVDFKLTSLVDNFYDPSPEANEMDKHLLPDGSECLRFNQYKKPKWMLDYKDEIENAAIPPVVEKYLNFLFLSNEPTIERILDWFANSLFDKDPIMLSLVSPGEGVGKSTLSALIGGLHDEERYYPATNDVINSQFNHALAYKSLVLFDEIRIEKRGSGRENLRRIIGNEVTTRRMHHDQGVKLDQPCSYICTSNDPGSLGIEGRGRRYFVPNIAHAKLDSALTSDEIIKLRNYSKAFFKSGKATEEEKREMARFAWFLFNRKESGVEDRQSELENINPMNFWTCKLACMKPWEAALIEYFTKEVDLKDTETLDGLVYRLSTIMQGGDKFLPRLSEVVKFITETEWRGTKLATLDEGKMLRESLVQPIVHPDFEFEKCVYDNEEDLL